MDGSTSAGIAIQQTRDGGFIVAGEIDPSGQFWEDSSLILLVKTDSMGNIKWYRRKRYEGIDHQAPTCVRQTMDGGYIIAATSPGAAGVLASRGAPPTVLLIKTDPDGNSEWTYALDGAWGKVIVEQTDDEGFVFLVDNGIYHNNQISMFLLKVNILGDEEWDRPKNFGEDGYSTSGRFLQQTNDGGFVLLGQRISDDDRADIILIKTDSEGNTQWRRVLGDEGRYEQPVSVQQTYDGGYIVGGELDASSLFLMKTDEKGIQQWSRTFNPGGSVKGGFARQTKDRGYALVGVFTFIATGGAYSGPPSTEIWLVKTDLTGQISWGWSPHTSSDETASWVEQTRDGGYIMTGSAASQSVLVREPRSLLIIKTDGKGTAESFFGSIKK